MRRARSFGVIARGSATNDLRQPAQALTTWANHVCRRESGSHEYDRRDDRTWRKPRHAVAARAPRAVARTDTDQEACDDEAGERCVDLRLLAMLRRDRRRMARRPDPRRTQRVTRRHPSPAAENAADAGDAAAEKREQATAIPISTPPASADPGVNAVQSMSMATPMDGCGFSAAGRAMLLLVGVRGFEPPASTSRT